MPRIDKAEMKAWMRGWQIVNEYERAELRRTPVETKCRQLAAMMRMARDLGWDKASEAEVQPVRDLWIRMKRKAARDRR